MLAQTTVDRVLAKYIQAIGGQAAYEKVATRTMRGSVEIPDDNVTAPARILAKAPASYRLTFDVPGYGVVETVLDGANGWEKNPDSGIHAMSKTDLAIARRDHHFYREVRLKELYPTMTMAGTDRVDGRAADVVEATPVGASARSCTSIAKPASCWSARTSVSPSKTASCNTRSSTRTTVMWTA